MDVKPGYKKTELGVIPDDWEVKSINSIASVTSGKRLPLGQSLTEHETPYPYLRVTDMRPGTVSLSDIKYVPENVFPAIKRYRIFKADIFISVAGTLGIVGKVPPQLDGANLTENADRITNIICSQNYLLHVLMSPLIQNTIDSLQTVGAQPKLALTRIRKFIIPHPPTKAEQEAIAEALSDADALIEALEQLITKKRNIKQGTMQELLTGKKRLPGFIDVWRRKRLEEVCYMKSGEGITSEDIDEYSEFPCYGGNGLRGFSKRYTHDGTYSLIGRQGALCGNVLVVTGKFFASEHAIVVTPNEDTDIHWLSFVLTRMNLNRYSESSAQPGLSVAKLLALECVNPPIPEQTAIATILNDMDAEIAALEENLSKARQIKQGMMQELLTGRIRLI